MDEELIARTVREVLQEIGRMEASAENSVSMDVKKAVNGYIHGMSLRLAEALAAKVEEKAEELGMRVVTAVADEAGHLKLVRSMDGAYIGSLDVAVNKAYTCAAFQMSTAVLGELARPGEPLYGIQHTNGGRIVIFGGGEPLVYNGKIIGALGVSGGTAEQDTSLAAYGASLLKEVISCL